MTPPPSRPNVTPTPDTDQPQPTAPVPIQYAHSANFPALLEQLGVSLAVTTYQAGKLMLVRSAGSKLSMLLRSLEQPMGLAVDPQLDRMVVGTRRTVWTLRAAPDIAPQLEPKGRHDACFVPRIGHVTGAIHGHEIVLVDGEPWIANTLLSCLCTIDDPDHGFVPRWRPPFIDKLAGEDRCHLNGIALHEGRVRFVTAMGETNTPGGWRDNKIRGGVVIDVASGETVVRGLCMPHSPRCFRGQSFVLDSGHGHLCVIDTATGRTDTVAALPGYARGLAFHGNVAFVGLSQVRESNIFGGLPITERLDETQRKCGVWAVDLRTGQVLSYLEFAAGCAEIFDIQVLPGLRWPTVIGFQDETIDGILIAPPGAWLPDAALPFARHGKGA